VRAHTVEMSGRRGFVVAVWGWRGDLSGERGGANSKKLSWKLIDLAAFQAR